MIKTFSFLSFSISFLNNSLIFQKSQILVIVSPAKMLLILHYASLMEFPLNSAPLSLFLLFGIAASSIQGNVWCIDLITIIIIISFNDRLAACPAIALLDRWRTNVFSRNLINLNLIMNLILRRREGGEGERLSASILELFCTSHCPCALWSYSFNFLVANIAISDGSFSLQYRILCQLPSATSSMVLTNCLWSVFILFLLIPLPKTWHFIWRWFLLSPLHLCLYAIPFTPILYPSLFLVRSFFSVFCSNIFVSIKPSPFLLPVYPVTITFVLKMPSTTSKETYLVLVNGSCYLSCLLHMSGWFCAVCITSNVSFILFFCSFFCHLIFRMLYRWSF